MSVAVDIRCDVSRSGSGRSFRSSDLSFDQGSEVGDHSGVCGEKSHVNEGFVENEADNANEG